MKYNAYILKHRISLRFITLALCFVLFPSSLPVKAAYWDLMVPAAGRTFRCVMFGNGQFVAAGTQGLIWSSPNGKDWTVRDTVENHDIYAMVYAGGHYVAVGRYGFIKTSPDLETWSIRKPLGVESLIAIAYNGNLLVAGGYNGAIWTSGNGNDWNKIDPGFSWEIWAMCYADGKFVGCGSNGHMCYSSDGINWTSKRISDKNLYSVAYGNGKFVIGGPMGEFFTSSGGVNWTRGQYPTTGYFMGLTFTGTHFVACGDGNDGCTLTLVSANGRDWVRDGVHPKYGKVNTTCQGIAAGNNFVVIAGGKSRILRNTYSGIGDGNGCQGTGPPPPPPPPPGGATITLATPNGSETWLSGSDQTITWTTTGTVETVDIEYTLDGSQWLQLTQGAANSGSYPWKLPHADSSACKVWIQGHADDNSTPTDRSQAPFTIAPAVDPITITVTSPNGNESWLAGVDESITWTTTGDISKVNIAYSAHSSGNWISIVNGAANHGSYTWTLPHIESDTCMIKVTAYTDSSIYDTGNGFFSIGGTPVLAIDKTNLNFGHIAGSAESETQLLTVFNSGTGQLSWNASSDAPWLLLNPTDGSDGEVEVSVNAAGLAVGCYSGTIVFSDAGSRNQSESVTVRLNLINSQSDHPPFGEFADPMDNVDGTYVSGSIAVTGWVLDDIGVKHVKIYRLLVSQSGDTRSFIGDAIFVEGARPGVVEAYPTFPHNSRAGWGYMLLTNFLPEGPLALQAVATDSAGQTVVLGTHTITVNNCAAVKPFGAIDSPHQGGTASGMDFINWAWVLTPNPNTMTEEGLKVWVDGVHVGIPTYNVYRSDIAQMFTGYANANAAGGYFYLDTGGYTNGVHIIEWSAVDSAGNTDGIGSRYFTVRNIQNRGTASYTGTRGLNHFPPSPRLAYNTTPPLAAYRQPLVVSKGYSAHRFYSVLPDHTGTVELEITPGQRLRIHLLTKKTAKGSPGNRFNPIVMNLEPLPVGASLDRGNGILSWMTGPVLKGDFIFHLAISQSPEESKYLNIRVTIKN